MTKSAYPTVPGHSYFTVDIAVTSRQQDFQLPGFQVLVDTAASRSIISAQIAAALQARPTGVQVPQQGLAGGAAAGQQVPATPTPPQPRFLCYEFSWVFSPMGNCCRVTAKGSAGDPLCPKLRAFRAGVPGLLSRF